MNPDDQKMNPQENNLYPRPNLMNPRITITFFVPYSLFLVWDSFVFTADTFQNWNLKGGRHESAAEWNVFETRKNESGRTKQTFMIRILIFCSGFIYRRGGFMYFMWIRNPIIWIRNPIIWIRHKQWGFSELIHLLYCGIHFTLLRTRFEKQIVSVHAMNPRQQKTNPDANKGHLRRGFIFKCADSLYAHADSLSNQSDSVRNVADSWKTHEYTLREHESLLKSANCPNFGGV
jgi:hypothetical protein